MLKKYIVSVLILILLGFFVFSGLNVYSTKEREILVGTEIRKYRLHLPKNYDYKKPYPLVLAFHSVTDTPRSFELITGLSKLADSEGFIVAYPYGTSSTGKPPYYWNGVFCCGYASKVNKQDVLFVQEVLGEVSDDYIIDKSRVYGVGYGAGGIFLNHLATQIDDFKAIGLVGAPNGGTDEEESEYIWLENTKRVLPSIIFHGTSDSVIPFDGGSSQSMVYNFGAAYDTVNFWVDNNSCARNPSEILRTDTYTQEIYSDCESNNTDVVFYTLWNKGHTWPGGFWDNLKNLFDKDSINASVEMLKFFSAHSS